MRPLMYIILVSVINIAALVPPLSALEIKGVVAYPVPFNPNRHILSVNDPSATPPATSIRINIYDVNGDEVFARSYTSFTAIKWNGRTNNGRKVKPGLYIIKVVAEDNSGGYGKKKIRILVDY